MIDFLTPVCVHFYLSSSRRLKNQEADDRYAAVLGRRPRGLNTAAVSSASILLLCLTSTVLWGGGLGGRTARQGGGDREKGGLGGGKSTGNWQADASGNFLLRIWLLSVCRMSSSRGRSSFGVLVPVLAFSAGIFINHGRKFVTAHIDSCSSRAYVDIMTPGSDVICCDPSAASHELCQSVFLFAKIEYVSRCFDFSSSFRSATTW